MKLKQRGVYGTDCNMNGVAGSGGDGGGDDDDDNNHYHRLILIVLATIP